MYKLGGMEDVLRTTLATYLPPYTGNHELDQERIAAFAEEVKDIIYRMRGMPYIPPENNNAYIAPCVKTDERYMALLERLDTLHGANLIDESDIAFHEELREMKYS
jgi:hypothetical protein